MSDHFEDEYQPPTAAALGVTDGHPWPAMPEPAEAPDDVESAALPSVRVPLPEPQPYSTESTCEIATDAELSTPASVTVRGQGPEYAEFSREGLHLVDGIVHRGQPNIDCLIPWHDIARIDSTTYIDRDRDKTRSWVFVARLRRGPAVPWSLIRIDPDDDSAKDIDSALAIAASHGVQVDPNFGWISDDGKLWRRRVLALPPYYTPPRPPVDGIRRAWALFGGYFWALAATAFILYALTHGWYSGDGG